MSLDSILRATGKNLFDCGEVSDYNFPIQQFNLTISNNTMSGVVLAQGNSGIININRNLRSGTYTFSSTISGTDIPNYRYMIRPYNSNNQIVTDLTISSWTYNQWYKAYIPNSSAQVRTFTIPDTVSYWQYGLAFLGTVGETVAYSNIQIEKGSTATDYEPFHRILQSVKMPSSSENLTPYPYADSDKTANGITFVTGYYTGITINGATDLPVGYIVVDNLDLTAGNYTFSSGCNSATIPNGVMIQLCYLENGSVKGLTSQLSGSKLQETFSIDDTIAQKKFRVVIVLNQDMSDSFSVNDLVFLPTLVKSENREVLKVSYNSRNLLPYPYFHSSMLQAGITYTVNSDGTITANGTATGRSEFVLSANKTDWANGNYILSGCPSGGSQATYSIITVNGFSDIGSGITVPQSELTRISIIIKQGTTVDNLVFKPQLELGDTKTDYVPYYHETVWIKEEIVATNKLGSFKLGESVLA